MVESLPTGTGIILDILFKGRYSVKINLSLFAALSNIFKWADSSIAINIFSANHHRNNNINVKADFLMSIDKNKASIMKVINLSLIHI